MSATGTSRPKTDTHGWVMPCCVYGGPSAFRVRVRGEGVGRFCREPAPPPSGGTHSWRADSEPESDLQRSVALGGSILSSTCLARVSRGVRSVLVRAGWTQEFSASQEAASGSCPAGAARSEKDAAKPCVCNCTSPDRAEEQSWEVGRFEDGCQCQALKLRWLLLIRRHGK